MAQKHSVELVCDKDDDETAGLRDEIKENLEKPWKEFIPSTGS